MALDIRPLITSDYDEILVGWWKRWRWKSVPPRDFLAGDGTGGYMIYDGDTPICAGFLYVSNSKVAWMDWIVSNFDYKDRDKRKEALMLLIDTLGNVAHSEGYKYTYALMKNPSLLEICEEVGYTKGDLYANEMIKIWD